MREARRGAPTRGKPACVMTRETVPWCTFSWLAIVPMRQCSAWK
jgi:hypothetical protein